MEQNHLNVPVWMTLRCHLSLLGNSEIDDPLAKASMARKPGGFDGHIETIKRIHNYQAKSGLEARNS
jgi:hypothetical protein